LVAFVWGINLLAHLFFIMKFWVLSHKLEALSNEEEQPDTKYELKVKVVYYSMLVFILLITVLNIWYLCSTSFLTFKGNEGNFWAWLLLFSSPAYLEVILLADALRRMRKSCRQGPYQVSNEQIVVQLVANTLFAISDIMPAMTEEFSFKLATFTIVTNWLGLVILLISLY
jgi:hypothetical protein